MQKKELEILLSKLRGFDHPKLGLEQYETSSSVAADMLWNAFNNGDIRGKVIADLGCGAGILGFGAALLGARKVFFVDIDDNALEIARKNKVFLEKVTGGKILCQFVHMPIGKFTKKVDVVLENPPFGTKNIHADKVFLEKAFVLAPVVYSFHKYSTREFVRKFAHEQAFHLVAVYRYRFPIRAQFSFHTSRLQYIDVACWMLQKD